MKFFFDNSLPPRFSKVIQVLSEGDGHGHVITSLRERFDASTLDTVWIPELAKERDWIVISSDARITTGRHEREAWQQSGLIGFFLAKGWASQDLWTQAWKFVSWWPRIVDQAGKVRAPATFLVPVKGAKFEQLR